MLGHLSELRRSVVDGESYKEQFEAAVLLIDLYEAILELNGILIYEDQEKVVRQ
jgi:hypothetical protein